MTADREICMMLKAWKKYVKTKDRGRKAVTYVDVVSASVRGVKRRAGDC